MKHSVEKEFLEVLKEHSLLVKKVCCMYSDNNEDRQDLQQEICLQLWKSYPYFKGNSKISTWLYKVALNTSITYFKKRKKNSEVKTCEEFYTLANNLNNSTEENEQLNQMYGAIGKLSKLEKALVMLYLDNKNYEEISEILGISSVNARVKIVRIKEKLRNLLKK